MESKLNAEGCQERERNGLRSTSSSATAKLPPARLRGCFAISHWSGTGRYRVAGGRLALSGLSGCQIGALQLQSHRVPPASTRHDGWQQRRAGDGDMVENKHLQTTHVFPVWLACADLQSCPRSSTATGGMPPRRWRTLVGHGDSALVRHLK